MTLSHQAVGVWATKRMISIQNILNIRAETFYENWRVAFF